MRTVVLGAGGHAKVVLETIWAMGTLDVIGLLDADGGCETLLGVPLLGGDELLTELRVQGVTAVVVALGGNRLRERIGIRVRELKYELPVVVHPAAHVSPSARIEAGAMIMARACIGPLAWVGTLAIVNTGAIVEHDNRIGQAAHVAPGVALAGAVTVGERALVGVGSAVRPGITIGADAVVGAGSAVVADVPDHAVVAGTPARSLPRIRPLA